MGSLEEKKDLFSSSTPRATTTQHSSTGSIPSRRSTSSSAARTGPWCCGSRSSTSRTSTRRSLVARPLTGWETLRLRWTRRALKSHRMQKAWQCDASRYSRKCCWPTLVSFWCA